MKSDFNRNAYNKISEQWAEARKQSFLNQLIIDFAEKLPPQGQVLDIGCGSGYPITHFLSKQGFQVTGIDISENLLAYAKKINLPNTTFHHCDFYNFEPPHLFDGVIAFDSFFHFPRNRQHEIFKKVSDWMKDGAYLLFTHGNENSEITGEMFGETFYYACLGLTEMKRLLQIAGLEIVYCLENYIEKHTQRDLVILARKGF